MKALVSVMLRRARLPGFQMRERLGMIAHEVVGGAEQSVCGRQSDGIGDLLRNVSRRDGRAQSKHVQIAQQPKLIEKRRSKERA
ncbi:hypothetical protein I6F35_10915 [Bradyrhizobium sp. BRP22]|uniref:hypothetical protein n=1 Tax=Bradyrhizobium sp. BRP22 TaxID=2793821 RepID=UPI001CD543AD|nr:hypothetical protein [Bradyrhizobium sp. BRP22]MCA1453722.1 hypothetical protein [Bradyrhizobium sp. BRP22]